MIDTIEYINPKELRPDPDQPRKVRNEAFIEGLAANILQKGIGIINPIEADSSGMIVTGELRWRASLKAELEVVPVKRVNPTTPEIRFLRQTSENLLQSSAHDDACTMSPIDIANALHDLLEMQQVGAFGEDGDTRRRSSADGKFASTYQPTDQGIRRLAHRLGKHHSWISRHLALITRLPNEVQDKIDEGKISFTAGEQITRVEPTLREEVARQVVQESEKGIVDAGAVAIVREATKGKSLEEAKPIIETLQAGRSAAQTVKAIGEVAPTPFQTIAKELSIGDKLIQYTFAIQTILKDKGHIEAFAKPERSVVVQTLQRLRTDIDDFLDRVDTKYLPIEAHNDHC